MTRLIVELSVATNLPFWDLAGLEEQVLATYVDVLTERNKQEEQ